MPYLTIAGTKLYYEDAGTGPTLLLVHGFPLDGRVWKGVVERLTARRRVIVPDLRGFGRSDGSKTMSMTQLAGDVAEVIRGTTGAPCAMAGLSMGGYVLQELARVEPGLVKHLILVDSKSEADTNEAKNKRNATAALVREKGSAAVAEQMLPNMLSPSASAEIAQTLRDMMASQRPETLAQASIAMRDREDFVDLLGAMDIPVDIVVGRDDKITPPELARAMHQKLKNGRLFEIPNAGHMAPLEQPQAVAEALLELTDGCAP